MNDKEAFDRFKQASLKAGLFLDDDEINKLTALTMKFYKADEDRFGDLDDCIDATIKIIADFDRINAAFKYNKNYTNVVS